MVGESGTGRNGIHQYYKCVSVKKLRGCKKKSVRKNCIEDIIVNETVDMLHDDAIFNYISDVVINLQRKENTNLPTLKQQLAETERVIDKRLNAIQQDI